MKTLFKNALKFLDLSLREDGQPSARKLSSFVTMILIVFVHIWWLRHAYLREDFNLLAEILIIDFSATGAFLGLKTWEDVMKHKHKKENTNITTGDIGDFNPPNN